MFFRYNFYGILWALLMFLLNLGREEGLENIQIFYHFHFDKLAHFIQFMILSWCLAVGFAKQQRYVPLRFWSWQASALVSIAYTFLLEGIQFARLPEYFEFGDLLANIFGSLGGVLLFYLIYLYPQSD